MLTSGHGPRGPSGSSEFLKLQITRKVKCNPLSLKSDGFSLAFHEGYRDQYAYVVLIADEEGKPCDARVVKTRETLNKIASHSRVLIHPQPIRIPSGFWERYREAKTPQERLALIKETELLKEENIFALTCFVHDIDTPYEEAEPIVLELFEKLGVRGYELGKSKSGNLRAVIYLQPLRVEVGDGENKKVKAFYPTPHGKNKKNGRTHLENAKEIVEIITDYLNAKGLKADRSFLRLNHPIWYGKQFYTREKKVQGETQLYDLYRKAKELQKELRAEKALKRPKKKNTKVIVPSFVAKAQVKALDDLARWRIAVRKLAEVHTSYRFTKVILPAVGWAKDLNLDRWEVDSYLKELLSDKRDMDEELERAWKYAKPTTFEWKGGKLKYDVNELVIRFLEELEETEGGANRQYLLHEVFGGQNWLLQMIERFCVRHKLVSVEKRKLTPGPGRKAYVYTLTEKGKSFVDALRDKELELSYRQVVGFDTSLDKKSNIKLPPIGGEQRVSLETLGLGGDGNNKCSPGETLGKGSVTLAPEKDPKEEKGDLSQAHLLDPPCSEASDKEASEDTPISGSLSGVSIFPDNGRATDDTDDIVRQKVEGIPEELVEKHLEGKEQKPKYDPHDPLEKVTVKRALELIERVEAQWMTQLGELPERNGYKRLIFGAVRSKSGRTYNLAGWGRFAEALGKIMEELGHRVIYPKGYDPWCEEGIEEGEEKKETPQELLRSSGGDRKSSRTGGLEHLEQRELLFGHWNDGNDEPATELDGHGNDEIAVDTGLEPVGEMVFQSKREAVEYLESLNGQYSLGDRVCVFVIPPGWDIAVPYEFEKVMKEVFRGFEPIGWRETWELKRIHWTS